MRDPETNLNSREEIIKMEMEDFEKHYPDDYFKRHDWISLKEELRMLNIRRNHILFMKASGVKFRRNPLQ